MLCGRTEDPLGMETEDWLGRGGLDGQGTGSEEPRQGSAKQEGGQAGGRCQGRPPAPWSSAPLGPWQSPWSPGRGQEFAGAAEWGG